MRESFSCLEQLDSESSTGAGWLFCTGLETEGGQKKRVLEVSTHPRPLPKPAKAFHQSSVPFKSIKELISPAKDTLTYMLMVPLLHAATTMNTARLKLSLAILLKKAIDILNLFHIFYYSSFLPLLSRTSSEIRLKSSEFLIVLRLILIPDEFS